MQEVPVPQRFLASRRFLSMRKRPSRRRWLVRYRLGKWIPWLAVEQHRLPVDQGDEVEPLTWHVRRATPAATPAIMAKKIV